MTTQVTVLVKPLGKPSRSFQVDDGLDLGCLLRTKLLIDLTGKTVLVNNEEADLSYILEDGDSIQITQNNEGA